MHWYVRYEGTGEISGSMSREDALQKAEEAGGMVFSEAILQEVLVVSSSEIQRLLLELKGLRETQLIVRNGEDDAIGTMLKEVSEALVLLSREKVVRGNIREGVLALMEIPEGVLVDIRDRDTDGMPEENLEEDESGSYMQVGG